MVFCYASEKNNFNACHHRAHHRADLYNFLFERSQSRLAERFLAVPPENPTHQFHRRWRRIAFENRNGQSCQRRILFRSARRRPRLQLRVDTGANPPSHERRLCHPFRRLNTLLELSSRRLCDNMGI